MITKIATALALAAMTALAACSEAPPPAAAPVAEATSVQTAPVSAPVATAPTTTGFAGGQVRLQAYQPGNAIYGAPFPEHAWFESYGRALTSPQPSGYTIPVVNGRTCAADYSDRGGDVEFKSCTIETRGDLEVSLWVDRNVVTGLITQGVALGYPDAASPDGWHSLYDFWRTDGDVVGQHPHPHINSPNHSDGHEH